MEDEDGQSVSKNEIGSFTTSDSSKQIGTVQNNIADKHDSTKLKSSLLSSKHGMPEESGGPGDNKDQESSSSGEKKINGEFVESGSSVPKENGSNTEEEEEEMAPLSIDVDESVEDRGVDGKQVEVSLKRKLDEAFQESSSSDDESHSSSPVEFRGFKKRMIAKAEKSLQRQRQIGESKDCSMVVDESNNDDKVTSDNESTKVLRSSSNDDKVTSDNENEKVLRLSSNDDKVTSDSENTRVLRSNSNNDKIASAGENTKVLRLTSKDDMVTSESENSKVLQRSSKSKPKSDAGDNEESEDQLTEYAQYLGLQPTVKFKCYRCGEKSFQSMGSLNAHQVTCSKPSGHTASVSKPPPHIDSNLSTNFRITRKVYLCSACGTYYENWKLFLHMRDVHKRHICLFCLGMFAVAEKLAEHLSLKHNVIDKKCKSPEEFLNIFKGSCYLTCCSCEKMFTERDDFFDHQCKDMNVASSSVCLTETSQQCTSEQQDLRHSQTASSSCQNQSSSNAPSSSVVAFPKRLVPVPTLVREQWTGKPIATKLPRTPTIPLQPRLEYMDASSFCHVDLDEAQSDSSRIATPSRKDSSNRSPILVSDSDSMDESENIKSSNSELPTTTENAEPTSKAIEEAEDNTECIKDQISEKIEENSKRDRISEGGDDEKMCNEEEESSRKESGDISRSDEPSDVVSALENQETLKEDQSEDPKPTADRNIDVVDLADSCSESGETSSNKEQKELLLEDNSNMSNARSTDDDNNKENDESSDASKAVSDEDCGIKESANANEPTETTDNSNEIISDSTDDKQQNDESSGENEIESEISPHDNSKQSPVDNPLNMEVENESDEEHVEGAAPPTEEATKLEVSVPEASSHSNSEISASTSEKKDEETKLEESVSESKANENDAEAVEDDAEVNNDPSIEANKITSKSSTSGSQESIPAAENNEMEESLENKQDTVEMDTNDGEQSENKQNGVSDSIQHLPENNVCSNEDDKSVLSEDSDKLSVVSEVSSNVDEDSHSENNDDDEEEENELVPKSNDDTAVHSESASQAVAANSDEIVNGDSAVVDSETKNVDSVVGIKETSFMFGGETFQIANDEVMAMALTLEDKMESLSAQSVIKECIRTSCTTCGYCNHAVKIGVNGKQLALHLLAEHRYKPVKHGTVDDVIERLKQALNELQDVWFNTDSYDSSDKSCFVPFDRTYDCFQCNFATKSFKDLFIHKRKVHQKTIHYCSMCKANFYSYSELLCHMCPGIYVSTDIEFRCCLCDLDRIPSSFRLMVHLRKTHHTCDYCVEIPGDQQKLSTHIWKHKLHHLCYRCGIAYRNKPDITKHLFWKHGTESVICKKCLQKKWPHVYHFCIPPSVFICEECNISFSRAVALKVHKRIHAEDYPYTCSECNQKFVSRKILEKHEKSHIEPPVKEEARIDETTTVTENRDKSEADMNAINQSLDKASEQVDGDKDSAVKKQEQTEEHSSKSHKKKNKKDRDKKNKPVVDVYDLPPLNLSSESDDSDEERKPANSNDNNAAAAISTSSTLPVESSNQPTLGNSDVSDFEKQPPLEQQDDTDSNVNSAIVTELTESVNSNEDNPQAASIIDGIWDNFHSYKAEQEKRESSDPNSKTPRLPYPLSAMPETVSSSIVLGDHDYCFFEKREPQKEEKPASPTSKPISREHSSSIDHDYCSINVNNSKTNSCENGIGHTVQGSKSPVTSSPKKKQKSPKKSEKHNSSSSSDSSSDSDSSSCSNSNCSCCSSGSGSSSSSSSDSDSSSSEGKRQGMGKRDRKKEKTRSKKKEETTAPDSNLQDEEPVVDLQVEPEEPPIEESDLDTDESSTDEDFYDLNPQRHANELANELAEKRSQLMVLAEVAPVNNGISSPPPAQVATEEPPPVEAPAIVQSQSPPVFDPLPERTSPQYPSSPPKPAPIQRRGRSKKRRKVAQTKTQNLPASPAATFAAYDSPQPSTSFSHQAINQAQYATPTATIPPSNQNSTPVASSRKKQMESDSSKRLSKRRRVPNKFYGYSGDEEDENQQQTPRPSPLPVAKWRKVEPVTVAVPPQPQPDFSSYQQLPKLGRPSTKSLQQEDTDFLPRFNEAAARRPAPAAPVSSSAGGSSSSSGSSGSESDSESEMPETIAPPPTVVINPPPEKDEKLYCYCQCPYDEVSEVIACDGSDCNIEWFHFECVGIMVPPKGKWYCPDCKRRKNLL